LPQSYEAHTFFHHQAYHASLQRLEQRLQGRSYGVSFFGYSTDPTRLVRYIKDVEKTAWSLKMFNPRTKAVLFTNQGMAPRPPFDDVVQMQDEDIRPACCKRNETWNILARVQYHQHSPYDLTVQIDSDRAIYDDIGPLFELLAGEWDVLGVSGGNLPDVDLGVLGYEKNEKVQDLLSAWAAKMKQLKHEGVDDQFSFTRVRDTILGLRMGFLHPIWPMKYAPSKALSHALCNQRVLAVCNVTYTMVMNGPVKIEATGYKSLDGLIARASFLNKGADVPRMYIQYLLHGVNLQVTS
jgi:hypothetical protein